MQGRVQLNLSITPEEKLALQALAEGRGVTVTRLVLGLIYQDVPRVTVEESGAVMVQRPDEAAVKVGEVLSQSPPARTFTPYSKEDQAGRKR